MLTRVPFGKDTFQRSHFVKGAREGGLDFEIGGHFERGWAVMLLEAEVVVVLLGDFWFWAGGRR
jgi:hypothetical protein